VIELEF